LQTHAEHGTFTEVDDAGGGDGVEFYLTRANGAEWGWQAKFYDGSPRLKESNRKQKIINSLKKALQTHPKMTVWILCTNSQFTPDEKRWFNSQLKAHIPSNKRVRLEHWSEGKLREKLDSPHYIGIKNAFFGTLQLSDHWFQSKFASVRHLVEEKFEENLHTKDRDLHFSYLGPLLVNSDFYDRCTVAISRLEASHSKYRDAVQALGNYSLTDIEWTGKKNFIQLCARAESALSTAFRKVQMTTKLITVNHIATAISLAKEVKIDDISSIEGEIKMAVDDDGPKLKLQSAEDSAVKEERLLDLRRKIRECSYFIQDFIRQYQSFSAILAISNQHHLHLLGNAGVGKTHICTALAQHFLDRQLPVIFIPGIKFSEHSTLHVQILQILDIAAYYTFDDFLETLNTLGHVYNVRVPIIIDGLNEAINDRGVLNPVWKKDLRALENQLQSLSNVVLLTTCRRSYKEEIWPNEVASNLANYEGFSSEEDRKLLIRRYFNRYQLTADLTYLSLTNFSHPLFLKIFCETKSLPGQDQYIQLGSESIYDIFRAFVGKCDRSVFDRLKGFGYAPKKEIKTLATPTAEKMGKILWESNARFIQFDVYQKIFNEATDQNFFTSKAKAVIDEGLLFLRDWYEEGELVGFTYDLVAGYCIASYLISEFVESLLELVSSDVFLKRLLSGSYQERHPLAEDILECFVALVPMRTGHHLFQLVAGKEHFAKLYELSFFSLFKISAQFIKKAEVAKVRSAFDQRDSSFREKLLQQAKEIFFVPDHPLNFLFFSKQLFLLPLTEKDLAFCEFLRFCEDEYWGSIITEFIERNTQNEPSKLPEQEAANDIVAEFFAWSLAVNLRKYRNEASEALYRYGRKYPSKFFDLLTRFVKIDDMYVRERLVAITYGLVSAYTKLSTDQDLVVKISLFIYHSFFKKNAPFSTTHILLRDYASQLVETACRTIPTMADQIDITLVRRPYKIGGVRKWKVSVDKNKSQYREGNTLIDYFFEKDELPRITKENTYKASKKTSDIKGNILWRVYDLGYKFEDFESIDQTIARWQGTGRRDEITVQKYGEKYVWIAYYELAGYLEDKGLIPPFYKAVWSMRNFGEGFDPTFPGPMVEKQYFEKDILGPKEISIRKWLDGNNIPDVKKILVVNDLTPDKESFVLVDAHKCQSDEFRQRQLFFWLIPILVDCANYQPAKKAILAKNVPGDVQPKYSEIIFQGEYPYSAYFPSLADREIEWTYKKEQISVAYVKNALFYKNRELSEDKQTAFWKEVQKKYSFTEIRHYGFQQEFYDDDGKGFSSIVVRLIDEKTSKNLDAMIAKELDARKYEKRTIRETRLEWKPVTKPIKLFLPVIDTNVGTCITKEIAEQFGLDSRPGSVDLYDKQGKPASISFRAGDEYNNNHHFTYFRKDLMDHFLKGTGKKMFWSYEGEWNHWLPTDFYPKDGDPRWKKFKKTIDYLPK